MGVVDDEFVGPKSYHRNSTELRSGRVALVMHLRIGLFLANTRITKGRGKSGYTYHDILKLIRLATSLKFLTTISIHDMLQITRYSLFWRLYTLLWRIHGSVWTCRQYNELGTSLFLT